MSILDINTMERKNRERSRMGEGQNLSSRAKTIHQNCLMLGQNDQAFILSSSLYIRCCSHWEGGDLACGGSLRLRQHLREAANGECFLEAVNKWGGKSYLEGI